MKPIIQKYKEINVGKFQSVKHFEMTYCNGNEILTNLVNISKDRQFAKSSPTFWLKNHDGKKWTDFITGLFQVPNREGVFFGDLRRKKDLLIMYLRETVSGQEIVFYVYRNNFPFNKNLTPLQLGLLIDSRMNKKTSSNA